MAKRIEKIDIRGFRSIKSLTIDELAQVTLFTGRNNTGKSSILEALRIWASRASMSTISEILMFREEDSLVSEDQEDYLSPGVFFQLSSLFSGFPSFSDDIEPLVISTETSEIFIRHVWFREEERENSVQKKALSDGSDEEALPGLEIDVDGNKKIYPLASLNRRFFSRPRMLRPEFFSDTLFPCEFVSPYGGENTTKLSALWDRIALSDRENDVVQALQIIDPNITAISMIGGSDSRVFRKAIVKVKGNTNPVPLRSFGDGLNRLFGIILSLVNARNGLVLIDEIENGLHYSIQGNVWKTIFELAKSLNVQVIATSHSFDAVKAFSQSVKDNPSMGALIRLTRNNNRTVAVSLSEDEIINAVSNNIEVR